MTRREWLKAVPAAVIGAAAAFVLGKVWKPRKPEAPPQDYGLDPARDWPGRDSWRLIFKGQPFYWDHDRALAGEQRGPGVIDVPRECRVGEMNFVCTQPRRNVLITNRDPVARDDQQES